MIYAAHIAPNNQQQTWQGNYSTIHHSNLIYYIVLRDMIQVNISNRKFAPLCTKSQYFKGTVLLTLFIVWIMSLSLMWYFIWIIKLVQYIVDNYNFLVTMVCADHIVDGNKQHPIQYWIVAPWESGWNIDVKDRHREHFLSNCPEVNATRSHLWLVNIGSGNVFVSSGNKPLPKPMLNKCC